MLVSPYAPGDRPKRLAGRSEDLQAIRDYLAPVLAYGEKANAQMILHGPRGVGKTSLMGAAADDAQRRGFVVAWTSCRRGEPFLADMVRAIDRELQRADTCAQAVSAMEDSLLFDGPATHRHQPWEWLDAACGAPLSPHHLSPRAESAKPVRNAALRRSAVLAAEGREPPRTALPSKQSLADEEEFSHCHSLD